MRRTNDCSDKLWTRNIFSTGRSVHVKCPRFGSFEDLDAKLSSVHNPSGRPSAKVHTNGPAIVAARGVSRGEPHGNRDSSTYDGCGKFVTGIVLAGSGGAHEKTDVPAVEGNVYYDVEKIRRRAFTKIRFRHTCNEFNVVVARPSAFY